MRRAMWDDTFKSQLCGAIWITRDEAHADDLRARLDAEWPALRDELMARVQTWKDEPQYEAFVLSVK